MSGSQLTTWPMPPTSSKIFTIITPPHLLHTPSVTYAGGDHLRRGVMSEYDLAHWTPHISNQLQCFATYSDTLCIGLHRLCDVVLPLVSTPPHMPPLCLFVYLFTLVPQRHMLLALFVYFPFQIVSIVDRQQADAKSNCTHCIRRGLGRRLRSSLLLNSSPRCDPPCKIPYLMF